MTFPRDLPLSRNILGAGLLTSVICLSGTIAYGEAFPYCPTLFDEDLQLKHPIDISFAKERLASMSAHGTPIAVIEGTVLRAEYDFMFDPTKPVKRSPERASHLFQKAGAPRTEGAGHFVPARPSRSDPNFRWSEKKGAAAPHPDDPKSSRPIVPFRTTIFVQTAAADGQAPEIVPIILTEDIGKSRIYHQQGIEKFFHGTWLFFTNTDETPRVREYGCYDLVLAPSGSDLARALLAAMAAPAP